MRHLFIVPLAARYAASSNGMSAVCPKIAHEMQVRTDASVHSEDPRYPTHSQMCHFSTTSSCLELPAATSTACQGLSPARQDVADMTTGWRAQTRRVAMNDAAGQHATRRPCLLGLCRATSGVARAGTTSSLHQSPFSCSCRAEWWRPRVRSQAAPTPVPQCGVSWSSSRRAQNSGAPASPAPTPIPRTLARPTAAASSGAL